MIHIEGNLYTTLPEVLLEEVTDLLEIYLDDGILENLPAGIFNGLTKLKALSLL